MIRISKWSEIFENAWTRKRVRLGWFNCPSGNDSSGYIALMSHGERGILAFSVFIAICQWSATCLPKIRGECARSDGRPLNPAQIAILIRMPEAIVEDAISLLASPEVGWMQVDGPYSTAEKTAVSQNLPQACHSSATDLPVICHESSLKVKGKKEKVKGEKETAIAVISANAESPPTEISQPVPYEEIRCEFDRTFGRSSRMTESRKKALASRWRDNWWRENWRAALHRGSASAFLKGANDRNWVIDLEFFLRPDSVTKILEGKYDNRQPQHKPPANSAAAREQRNADAFAVIEALAAAQTAASGSGGDQDGVGFHQAALCYEEHGGPDTLRTGDVGSGLEYF